MEKCARCHQPTSETTNCEYCDEVYCKSCTPAHNCQDIDCSGCCFGCGGSEITCDVCGDSVCLMCLLNIIDQKYFTSQDIQFCCSDCAHCDNECEWHEIDALEFARVNPDRFKPSLGSDANDIFDCCLGYRDPTYQ